MIFTNFRMVLIYLTTITNNNSSMTNGQIKYDIHIIHHFSHKCHPDHNNPIYKVKKFSGGLIFCIPKQTDVYI